MRECGPAIELCNAGEYVCQKGFLIFQIQEGYGLLLMS
jgi:hypothetical protein